MSETDNSSYKQSLKATSLFGGVQVFNILVQLVKSKIIALLLGPTGMGVYGLFTQTDALIKSCTSLGLSSSAVRNISEANGTGDERRVSIVTTIFRKLVWLTGLLGLLVCLLGSPIWSKLTFGNYDYTLGFVVLSAGMLFQQLTLGQTAVLQGLRKYSFMAKAGVFGNIIGLLITIPLYYIWRIDAIVPVLVLSTLTALGISCFFYRKLGLSSVKVDRDVFFKEAKNMVIMGVSISFSGIVGTAIAYYLRTYIEQVGGLSEVGLFTAGFAIVETYIGLVMTSMGTDYYPRLSEVNKDVVKFSETINRQIEIALLLLAPIIATFIIFIEIFIIMLYSGEFLPAEGMMYWAIYGAFFKAISWAVAFGMLAKGDYKMFLVSEVGAGFYNLFFKIIGYNLAGITGIGVAYLVGYILYTIQVCVICRYRYNVVIEKIVIKVCLMHLPILTACLLITLLFQGLPRYLLGVPFVIISCYLSYRQLQQHINVKDFVSKMFKRK